MSSQESGNSVVIVGSGVAGSALATVLARDGRDVTVIERSMVAPERMNGEGMQAGGMDALRDLGLEECVSEADGVVWTGLCMIDKATGRNASLPFSTGVEGYTLKNHLFVQALRKRAQQEKRCTYIEASVVDVIEEDGAIKGVTYRRKNADKNEKLRADLSFICDGSYSRLRKINVSEKPIKDGTFVGFLYNSKYENELLSDLQDPQYFASVYIGPRSSTSTYNVNKEEKRVMCYVRGDWPADLTEYVKKQIKNVSDDLGALMLADVDEVKFDKVHSFRSHSKAEFRSGAITIGDALNQRHPITAAGMSVALKDIIIWRDLLREIPHLGDMDAMRAAHMRFLYKRREYTFVVNLNARMFGEITYPTNDEGEFDRDCMLDYLLWSPKARREMAAILAIKETRPRVLLYHLAMSTLYNTCCVVWRNGWNGLPIGLLNGAKSLYAHTADLMSLIWEEYHSSN